MSNKKIVFVTYGGGHVNMLIPVIHRLQTHKGLEIVVLGLTTAGSELEKHGIPYIGFKDLLQSEDQEALEWGRRLVSQSGHHPNVPYDESVAYMGLSYMDLVFRHGASQAASMYKEGGGRQAFYPLTVMEKFLRSANPDLVVATNSPRAERAAITVAGRLGVPSVCVVDLFAFQEIQWIGQPDYATKICVLSDFVKSLIVEAGRNQDDVVVTGNPSFDRLIGYRRQMKALRKNKGWSDEEKVILWVSQPEPLKHPFNGVLGNPELPRAVERELLGVLYKHAGWRLVIRPHPSEEVSYADLPENAEVSFYAEPLYDVLAAVDAVVVMSSTVGLEAVLLGKPLISIDMSVFTKDAPYSEMGIAKGVSRLDELGSAIETVLAEGWRCNSPLPDIGCATDKVLSVIEEYV